jgi:hypothetical protein
LSFEHLRQA